MKVLLTGAKGQLGSDLGPLLRNAGFETAAFTSSELDITDGAAVFSAVRKEKPGLVINAAAYTKVDLAEKERERAFAVNSDGPANLGRAALEAGIPLVHVSTDFVFDGRRAVPYREDDATNPQSAYGESKLAGEAALAALLDERVVIRTSWVYGVTGHNFVKTILRLASERESLRVVYDQVGSPTWSADLARAIVEVAKAISSGKSPWGTYHYSNEGVASWFDFAVAVCEDARALGIGLRCSEIEPILTAEYPVPARRPAFSVLDKARIKGAFGLRIPYWRDSLRLMLKELKGGWKCVRYS